MKFIVRQCISLQFIKSNMLEHQHKDVHSCNYKERTFTSVFDFLQLSHCLSTTPWERAWTCYFTVAPVGGTVTVSGLHNYHRMVKTVDVDKQARLRSQTFVYEPTFFCLSFSKAHSNCPSNLDAMATKVWSASIAVKDSPSPKDRKRVRWPCSEHSGGREWFTAWPQILHSSECFSNCQKIQRLIG